MTQCPTWRIRREHAPENSTPDFSGGVALPNHPTRWGDGATRLPHPPCSSGPCSHQMKKGCSWEGFALPDPPVGRGPGARASGPHPQGNNRVLLGGLRPPRPSRGWGHGETGLPHAPAPQGDGATRFPHTPAPAAHGHVRRSCAWRTTPNEHDLGARASRPRHGSAGKVTALLPSPPPAGGRESGSSPQRGEVRRGGSAPHTRR